MAVNYEKIMAYASPERVVQYGERDCILYALGLGIGMDPMDRGQLKFVYEKGLEAFPTMAGVLGWVGRELSTNPEFGIDERMVVAAEQRITLFRPLAPAGTLRARTRVKQVIDKGPGGGAIIQAERKLLAPDGTAVASVETSTFARGQGGFGGPVTESPPPHKVPDGTPQFSCDLPTPPNLAILYRLNGDTNPLHVDPERARVAGFPRPILHGVATYGIAAHAVLRTLAGCDAVRLRMMEARFVRPVFPGDTIRTEMWVEGESVSFRCRVPDRDVVVLDNGLARIAPAP
ncbi:MAG: MaoC family dehydratase N-terminal domain-containing protein [Burkholderiales bacterium]|nr:MaoC family dehydratase N-terminal domain-containing protein [Burkholderiales bacterium]